MRLPQYQSRLLLMTLSALFTLQARGEGAVQTLECTTLRLCDEAGECMDAAEEHEFRLEPIAIELDGSGQWTISYEDRQASMQGLSEAGPFYWTTAQGRERHTLMASSETHFVWHSLSLTDGPQARVRFMACVFTR